MAPPDENHDEVTLQQTLETIAHNGGRTREAVRNIKDDVSTLQIKYENVPTKDAIELIVKNAGDQLRKDIKQELESTIQTQIALAIQTIKTNTVEDQKEEILAKQKEKQELIAEIRKQISDSQRIWRILERIVLAAAVIIGLA